jgi:hypothetical protein
MEWVEHFKEINAMDNPLVIMAMCEMAKGLTEEGTLVNTQVVSTSCHFVSVFCFAVLAVRVKPPASNVSK